MYKTILIFGNCICNFNIGNKSELSESSVNQQFFKVYISSHLSMRCWPGRKFHILINFKVVDIVKCKKINNKKYIVLDATVCMIVSTIVLREVLHVCDICTCLSILPGITYSQL